MQVEAILRSIRLALATQDTELKYTAAINRPLAIDTSDFIGKTDEEAFTTTPGRDLKTSKERVLATGKSESIDLSIGAGAETRWYRVWIEPLANGKAPDGVLSASVDITEQKNTEELLRLALLELAHRSKNLLSVVLSIARQTTEESTTLEGFTRTFLGRIRSLSLAHDVLTDERWRGATLFGLVRSQLSAFAENALAQSEVAGHNAFLKPNAVQYVGLALHELIAQSILTGALAQPNGHIRVEGTLGSGATGERDLTVSWEESGLQQAMRPASAFGYALLEKIIPAALSGSAVLDISAPGKLTYKLTVPSSQFF
jgi:two-component sensor histidine kinase